MTIGISSAAIIRDIGNELRGLDEAQVQKIAQAVASVIEKNNQEIDRELGRRFANIERRIGH